MGEFNLENAYQLIGPINDESTRNLISWFVKRSVIKNPEKTLYLLINSCGGSVSNGFAFTDLVMATRSVELYTLAAGEVDSMAIPIFLSGKKRLIAPTSSIFFHEIGRTFSKDVRYSTSELHRLATDMTESEQAYATFIASRCNMWRPEDVLDAMRAERKLKAEEAVKLGIAHAILNQSNIPF